MSKQEMGVIQQIRFTQHKSKYFMSKQKMGLFSNNGSIKITKFQIDLTNDLSERRLHICDLTM